MNWLSVLRLLSLVAIVWFIVLAVKHENPVFYACSGAMLMLFLFLVKRYNFQKDLRNLNIRIRDLNQKELSCLEHQFMEYPDGREFADPSASLVARPGPVWTGLTLPVPEPHIHH